MRDPSRGPGRAPFDPWRHRFACLTAASTVALIFVGGLVTSTGSGLSVPDWPLSYGTLMPPMVGGVRFEHSHRLVAGFVGLLTLALAVWTGRSEPRRGVRRLAWGALLAVAAQAVLGGLTVIFLLPTAVSVAHACLAQTFLCLAVVLAYATSREWLKSDASLLDEGGLRRAALAASVIVYAQLVLGAVMRHVGAGLAIPDFPLAYGRLVPPLDASPVRIHFAHRVVAVIVLAAMVWLVAAARRTAEARLRRHALALLAIAVVQTTLGALTVLTGKAVVPATAHVAGGAVLLAGCFLLLLRSHRLLLPRSAPPVPAYGLGHQAAST